MPRPGPRRQFVGARMSAEQIDGLRAAAELAGVDVSDIIRQAIDEYLTRAGVGAPGSETSKPTRAPSYLDISHEPDNLDTRCHPARRTPMTTKAHSVIAPYTPEARLVRAAALDVATLHALANQPRTQSRADVAARLATLSEVAVYVLRIAGLSIPPEFRALMNEAVAEVGPYPPLRGAPEGRETWHTAVLGAVNERLAQTADASF